MVLKVLIFYIIIKKTNQFLFLDYYLYPILDISKKNTELRVFLLLYNITSYRTQAAEYTKSFPSASANAGKK